jgi:Zn-finger nucleic acid-binding protein
MSNHQGLACPACRVDLVMAERAGVEIDYCPKCRGVWLDRGELDKIIERGSQFEARAVTPQQPPQPQYAPQHVPQAPQPQPGPYGGGNYHHPGGYPAGGYGYKKKRKNWLEEIFD